MANIILLSSKIYNRIAAGEVVERPFSVVKELVENSIDAGATKIVIEIIDGGITLIKVTDNGIGIEKDDLKNALMPHATSKISTVDDLDNVVTLGFRGEALPSIASVSKLKITSKTKSNDIAYSIFSEGGIIGNVVEDGLANGTEISASNLFFNTPVRAKFLKTPKSEENEISAYITRFILGNPNIAFKLIIDGKTTLQSFGDGLESAFVCVYGSDALKDCFYIDTIKNGLHISGYIGKHYFVKSNKSHQTIFINSRYVVNQTISSAIANAYSTYLMKRQYPFYVLKIDMPSEIVDVNVHPNKTDVRFLNNQVIYGSIYSVISKVLDGTNEALNIISSSPTEFASNNQNIKQNPIKSNTNYVTHNIKSNTNVAFDFLNFSDSKIENLSNDEIFRQNKEFLQKLENDKVVKQNIKLEIEEKQIIRQECIDVDRPLNFIGQVLNTYLILENGEDVFFIDQHAAHERLLYDKLIEDIKNNQISVQPLLIPYILDVNSKECDFILSKSQLFNDIGIEIENFGLNSFKISSLPAYLSNMNIKNFFSDVLSDIEQIKEITIIDILKEKIAQKACKSAIKSGDKLSQSEIDALICKLKDNLGLKCPHGRPVAIKITRMEIDKWFKRIL